MKRLCVVCKAQKQKSPSVIVKVESDLSAWGYCERHDPTTGWNPFGKDWLAEAGWCRTVRQINAFRQFVRLQRLKEIL